jgi:hypothetical protein
VAFVEAVFVDAVFVDAVFVDAVFVEAVFVEAVFVEAVFVEAVEPGSDEGPDELVDAAGDAQANPAGVAIAVPTPRAMAKAPILPTYLL